MAIWGFVRPTPGKFAKLQSQLIELRKSGSIPARRFGFVTFGGLSVLLFLCCASLSPPATQDYLLSITGVIYGAILSLAGNSLTIRIIDWVDVPLCVLVFTLPEIAIALGGTWWAGRSGKGS